MDYTLKPLNPIKMDISYDMYTEIRRTLVEPLNEDNSFSKITNHSLYPPQHYSGYEKEWHTTVDTFTAHYIFMVRQILKVELRPTECILPQRVTRSQIAAHARQVEGYMANNTSRMNANNSTIKPYWITMVVRENFSDTMLKDVFLNDYKATHDTKTEQYCITALSNIIQNKPADTPLPYWTIENKPNRLACGELENYPHQYVCITNRSIVHTLRVVLATVVQKILLKEYTGDPKIIDKYLTPLSHAFVAHDYEAYKAITLQYHKEVVVPGQANKTFDKLLELFQMNDTREISQIQNKLTAVKNNIAAILENYSSYLTQQRTLQQQLTGLYTDQKKHDYTSLCKQLLSYKALRNIQVFTNPCKLNLTITAPVTNYDAKQLDKILQSTNSRNYYRIYDDNVAIALDEVFIKKKYTLNCVTCIRLSLETNSYSQNNYGGTLHDGILPNPHMRGANCFGNNASLLRKAITERDILTATDIIIAATSNINFGDPSITKYFMDQLHETQLDKIFTDNETGELVSIKEIAKRVKPKEGENE